MRDFFTFRSFVSTGAWLVIPFMLLLPILNSCQPDDSALDYVAQVRPAFAEVAARPIRVLLASSSSFEVASQERMNVYSSSGALVAEDLSGTLTFKLSGGRVDFRGASSDEFTVLAFGGYLSIAGKQYRGKMRIAACDRKLLLINVIELDEYLRGVVPAEVPASWPIESIKAQAVAARTYAVSRMMDRAGEPWDVVATTADQVYKSIGSEKESTDLAIAETAGQVLVWAGKPIIAYYHADSGGYTKEGRAPYLKPVPSLAPESPYSFWELTYTPDEFRALLESGGMPYGEIAGVEGSYDSYGRCQGVTVTTSKQSYGMTAANFRKLIGVMVARSTMFRITYEGGIVWDKEAKIEGWQKLYVQGAGGSSLLKIRKLYSSNGNVQKPMKGASVGVGQRSVPSLIRVTGSGFGHGTGMSQWGALHMANEGASYDEILLHFYTGVSIVNIADVL